MHIEFAEIIRMAALDAIAAGQLPGDDSAMTIPQVHADIAECVERGDVSSSWSFRFTSWSKSRGRIIEPLRVSEVVREQIMRGERGYFEVVLSPNGYLNASLTCEGRAAFLQAILSENWQGLFTSTVLVGDGTSLATSEKVTIDDIIVSCSPPAQVICQQCELLEQLFDRPVIEQLPPSVIGVVPRRSELALMACAVLARKEYRLEPFVEGLKCKENVPWYCHRGLKDMNSFIRLLSRQMGSDMGREREEKLFAAFATEIEDLLVRFRSFSIPALRGGRYDKLAEYTLAVLDCFYRYYNHPHVRYTESVTCRDRLLPALSCQMDLIKAGLRILGGPGMPYSG
ncbi:MAG: hypothetical protein PHC51_08935 [bacterium]|nr:hypothetical protein [bacterium]